LRLFLRKVRGPERELSCVRVTREQVKVTRFPNVPAQHVPPGCCQILGCRWAPLLKFRCSSKPQACRPLGPQVRSPLMRTRPSVGRRRPRSAGSSSRGKPSSEAPAASVRRSGRRPAKVNPLRRRASSTALTRENDARVTIRNKAFCPGAPARTPSQPQRRSGDPRAGPTGLPRRQSFPPAEATRWTLSVAGAARATGAVGCRAPTLVLGPHPPPRAVPG